METAITVTTALRNRDTEERVYYALSQEQITEKEATEAVEEFLRQTTVKFKFIQLNNAMMAEGLCFKYCAEFHSTNLHSPNCY